MHVAVELGQGGFSYRTKPKHAYSRGEEKQQKQAAGGIEKNPRPAAFAATARRGLGCRHGG
jgi:hypothetical protein